MTFLPPDFARLHAAARARGYLLCASLTIADGVASSPLAYRVVPVDARGFAVGAAIELGEWAQVHEWMDDTMTDTLKPPFPYFGGKTRIAAEVWRRFGRVDNFIDPFFGSGAVLLGCPHPGHTETVNDADGLLCNFFRALQHDPDAVAAHADYPVVEIDLHARHRWLVHARADIERLLDDPAYYDAKAAGWWVWGISQWIGSGWCDARRMERDMGVHRASFGKIPHLGNEGRGVHRASFGKIPHLGGEGPGMGIHRQAHAQSLAAYFQALAARLRRVRVTCGDWSRVLGPSVTWGHGATAVFLDPKRISAIFLDPPYSLDDRASVYALEDGSVAQRARKWAIENGDNPLLRIALCGYEGHYDMPDGWECFRWKAHGGYGSQGNGRGRTNAAREVVWFSPHCLNLTPLEQLLEEGTNGRHDDRDYPRVDRNGDAAAGNRAPDDGACGGEPPE